MTDEFEIDLRPYIKKLLRYWYLVVFIPIAAAILVYFYLNSKPPFYEATAMVAITESDILVNFGSSIETLDEGRPAYQALPSFASSSEIIHEVYNALEPKPDKIHSAGDLMDHMVADSGDDLRLLLLTVTMPSAEEAARVANVWAELFIQKAHAVYGDVDTNEVSFYETEIAENQVAMEDAENALIAFESRDELPILRNQLNVYKDNYDRYLRQHENIEIIIRDLLGLRTNLDTRNPNEPAFFADQLSLLSLQNSAFSSGASLPFFLQFQEDTVLQDETVGQQLQKLDSLVTMLRNKQDEIMQEIELILPTIAELQEQISTLEVEQTHLNRTLDLKRYIDTTLTRKLEEVKLTSKQTSRAFRHAGKAMAPEEPAGPHKLMPTAVTGLVTGVLVVGILFFSEYWQSILKEEKEENKLSSQTSFNAFIKEEGLVEVGDSQVKEPTKVTEIDN